MFSYLTLDRREASDNVTFVVREGTKVTRFNELISGFQEKTRDLADFLYRENVDPMLTVKTLKYFDYVWNRTHGSDPQVIFKFIHRYEPDDLPIGTF